MDIDTDSKRGLIVTMASLAGVSIVSPMLAPYAASKVFLASFNAALQEEVRGKGIDVETLDTYFVVSAMSKVRKASAFVPMPKQFVQSALAKVRTSNGSYHNLTDVRTDQSPLWCALDRSSYCFQSLLEPLPSRLDHGMSISTAFTLW